MRDWNGKSVVAGQRQGFSEPFQGKIYTMKWDGKSLVEGELLPLDTAILPVSAGGVYSLSPWPSGKEARWLYVDVEEKLRVLDSGGKSVYKSKEKGRGAADAFEYGEISRQEGRYPTLSVRRAPRAVAGPKGEPFVVVTEVRTGDPSEHRGIDRVVEDRHPAMGGQRVQRAGRVAEKRFFLQRRGPAGFRQDCARAGKAIASVIEQSGTAFKDRVSRLVLMQVE